MYWMRALERITVHIQANDRPRWFRLSVVQSLLTWTANSPPPKKKNRKCLSYFDLNSAEWGKWQPHNSSQLVTDSFIHGSVVPFFPWPLAVSFDFARRFKNNFSAALETLLVCVCSTSSKVETKKEESQSRRDVASLAICFSCSSRNICGRPLWTTRATKNANRKNVIVEMISFFLFPVFACDKFE